MYNVNLDFRIYQLATLHLKNSIFVDLSSKLGRATILCEGRQAILQEACNGREVLRLWTGGVIPAK